jgi:amidophosphoribosyltransferase
MPCEAKEECGVAAISLFDNVKNHPKGAVAYYLMKMLLHQQNRGQLGAGITTFNKDRGQILETHRENGLVNEVFRMSHRKKNHNILKHFSGTRGIGHTRYATSGADDRGLSQPFERRHGRIWKWFSFAFNGNLANFVELKQELRKSKYHLVRNTDTEIIMHFLSKQFLGPDDQDLVKVFGNLSTVFDGAYNIVYMNAKGDLIALRDPLGFRPLSYAFNDTMVGAASESMALTGIGINNVKPLEPGQMLRVNKKGYDIETFAKSKRKAMCMFEYVYFANVSSTIDGRSVYSARWDLGTELAKREFIKTDDDTVVVGVPETSRPIADAIAHELGLPTKEGLIRNRYLGRVFIEGSNRDEKIKDKFNLLKQETRGKKLIVADDSIVRGTTSKALVDYLKKEGGAKEVHLRVACPPIRYPCFYGIDFSTCSELVAARNSKDSLKDFGKEMTDAQIENIRKETGADSLIYQNVAGLVKGIKLPKKDLCMACLTGEYPTPCGRELVKKAIKTVDKTTAKRTYE